MHRYPFTTPPDELPGMRICNTIARDIAIFTCFEIPFEQRQQLHSALVLISLPLPLLLVICCATVQCLAAIGRRRPGGKALVFLQDKERLVEGSHSIPSGLAVRKTLAKSVVLLRDCLQHSPKRGGSDHAMTTTGGSRFRLRSPACQPFTNERTQNIGRRFKLDAKLLYYRDPKYPEVSDL